MWHPQAPGNAEPGTTGVDQCAIKERFGQLAAMVPVQLHSWLCSGCAMAENAMHMCLRLAASLVLLEPCHGVAVQYVEDSIWGMRHRPKHVVLGSCEITLDKVHTVHVALHLSPADTRS